MQLEYVARHSQEVVKVQASTAIPTVVMGFLLEFMVWVALATARPGSKPGPRGSATEELPRDVSCATIPSPFPKWSQLPQQTTLPDPFLPLGFTTTDNAGSQSASAFAQDVMTGKGKNRIQTPEEWYQCRQPEILNMLQEYQYGYYPDHSQETVTATRSGNTVSISVTASGKTGKFSATVKLPTGASKSAPAPVVINIGGMQDQPYLQAGIAVVGFDYTSVAADSNSKTGAFWSIYNGRDIGEHALYHSYLVVSPADTPVSFPPRSSDCLGLGIPPHA